MNQSRLNELERLANQAELVAHLPYSNPDRNPQQLCAFVNGYADSLDVAIDEKQIGFLDAAASYSKAIKQAVVSRGMSPFHRLANGLLNILGILELPFYPIFSVTPYSHCKETGEDHVTQITIANPKYPGLTGLILGDSKPHEYQHAYHLLVAKDLYRRGLLSIRGTSDIGWMEPGDKTPTREELKDFERKVLNAIITREKAA